MSFKYQEKNKIESCFSTMHHYTELYILKICLSIEIVKL